MSHMALTLPGDGLAKGAANTLHLTQPELDRLAAELDARSGDGGSRPRRKYARWPYRQVGQRCDLVEPNGGVRELVFAARDLSSTGISLLHSAYVHVNIKCTVHLQQTGSGLAVPVQGVVTRCRHVRGPIHEFAVRFAKPINVREFVRVDPFEGCFTLEDVDADKLSGSVLHIEDSPTDRALVRQFLKNTGLTVTSAESGEAGVERGKEPYDLILCAQELPDVEGVKVIERLRAAEVQTPVVILSADLSPPFRQRVKTCRANAFVAKPPEQGQLLRAIAEFLLLGGTGSETGGAIYSSLKADAACMELVPDYVAELRSYAGVIEKKIAEDDAEGIRRICLKLMGSSRALGFEPIAEAAETAFKAVTASSSATESRKPIMNLVGVCQRARTRAGRKAA